MKRLAIAAVGVALVVAMASACGGEGEQEVVVTPGGPTETASVTKTFSKYGFSFEYPKDLPVAEMGLLENEANDNSGMVLVGVENGEVNSFQVGWMKTLSVDLDAALEGSFVGAQGAEGIASVDRGELVEADKAGHRMLHQSFTATSSGGDEVRGISSVFYCDETGRLFIAVITNNTFSAEQEVLEGFETYLDSLVCH